MTAAPGLQLQVCQSCGWVQYPNRQVCRECLDGELERQPVDDAGRMVSWTPLHASLDPWFAAQLPWPVASVKLNCGPVVLAHLIGEQPHVGQQLRVSCLQDPEGREVLVAFPSGDEVPDRGRVFGAAAS